MDMLLLTPLPSNKQPIEKSIHLLQSTEYHTVGIEE